MSRGNQQFFPDAKNIVISGGTFTNTKTVISTRDGFVHLLRNICDGAFHNSAERGDPPRCHPHTREAIRADIMEWIKAPQTMRKLILWMYGPAGSGKTAIAQSIAEECERLGLLAASFFFWRMAAGRNNTSQFVATLAYQLSRYIPQMKDHLLTAVEDDPAIFSRSLSTQMRVLVIEPLKLATPFFPIPIFAIVDGIDECGPDGQSQFELLHLLGSTASELEHFPLIFLIAGRPEYEIREAFNGNLLCPLTKVLVLDDNYKPDEDIKLYFDSMFHGICEKHRRLGRRLPSPWPNPTDVDFLISKASGQFIFAATVTKFIDSPRHNPADRLDVILRLSASENETPFALLDALYRFVLDSVADVDKVLDILAWMFLKSAVEAWHDYDAISSLDEAEEFLGIEFQSALIDMHSLVHISPPSDTVAPLPSVYHASFEDFLMDRSRSRQYYIGASEGHLRISRRILKALQSHQHFQRSEVLNDFCHHAEESLDSEDLANDLAYFDLKALLVEYWAFEYAPYDMNWHRFFDVVKQKAGSDRLDIFLRLQHDFDTFIFDRLAKYPPSLRTHIPVLLSCLRDKYQSRFPDPSSAFQILLYGTSNLGVEYNELLNLDKRLLYISRAFCLAGKDKYWSDLFGDKDRSGEYFVDGGSYAAAAKAIISVICPRLGERNHGIEFNIIDWADYEKLDNYNPTMEIPLCDNELLFFPEVLKNASTDLDFAKFLRERAVQFRNDVQPIPGRRKIAEASIKYIQRCGIPFLEHRHQPGINECAICINCVGAIVVEDAVDFTDDGQSASLSISNYSPFNPLSESFPFFYHKVLNPPPKLDLCATQDPLYLGHL